MEAEILRHGADAFADPLGISAHIQSFDAGFPAAQRKQAGQHFDDGGFAAAVGSEKTKNFAASHRERNIFYRGEVSEFANQPARGNRRTGSFGNASRTIYVHRHNHLSPSNLTSAAIPGSTRCEVSSMRIFTPKTWCTRSSGVCTLRGRNSACWLICSTIPPNTFLSAESTLT